MYSPIILLLIILNSTELNLYSIVVHQRCNCVDQQQNYSLTGIVITIYQACLPNITGLQTVDFSIILTWYKLLSTC